jgi:rhodanese-related sulfurtransferase
MESPMTPIDAPTLDRWLKAGEAVLVDVREPAEHAARRIAGARLIPLGAVSAGRLPDLAGRKLVIHCQKGGRGNAACEKLLRENPALEVYNLAGGIEAWGAAGLPLRGQGGFLPLDRQTQLAIGSALIAAALLSWLVSPVFLALVAVFGVGLVMAGVTGFCGLTRLLALMPWNRKGG